jgi:hypothetical protein
VPNCIQARWNLVAMLLALPASSAWQASCYLLSNSLVRGEMNKREWWRSIFLIAALLAAAILVAQSRRNCEIPGSSFVPWIWGKQLKTP